MGLITNIDYTSIWDGKKSYAVKVGRVAARPVLLLYYDGIKGTGLFIHDFILKEKWGCYRENVCDTDRFWP